jgi:putative endonuclease
MYVVYILRSRKDSSLYIGYTGNLEKRLIDHNLGKSTYTRTRIPWDLVYKEEFKNKKEAIIRERFLKNQKNREFYSNLIKLGNSVD